MQSAYFVNLNELEQSETEGFMAQMKTQTTEDYVWIRQMYISPFKIQSYHRFFGTTNPKKDNPEPIRVYNGGRRVSLIKCSDDLVGNYEFFSQVNNTDLPDDEVILMLAKYLTSLPGLEKYFPRKLIETEFHQLMANHNDPYILQWLRTFILEGHLMDKSKKTICPAKEEMFLHYLNWKTQMNLQHAFSRDRFDKLVGERFIGKFKENNHSGESKTKRGYTIELSKAIEYFNVVVPSAYDMLCP